MADLKCPKCGNEAEALFIGVEYAYGHPDRYDGVSEWICKTCGTRLGRWSGKVLQPDESEKRFGGRS